MKRIKTGIPGLDELIGGGIPSGRAILITGGPGTGKTTFGIQFVLKGILDYDQNGIIVTFEESAASMKENVKNFGWDLKTLQAEEKLAIVDAAPIRRNGNNPSSSQTYGITQPPHPVLGSRDFGMKDIISLIHEKRREINAQRITVDSLTTLLIYRRDIFEIRQEIVQLVKSLKNSKMTSLLISENPRPSEIGRFGVEAFLTEGVILLQMMRRGNTRIRALDILKMRGVEHSMDATMFRITNQGIIIYLGERVYREDESSIIA